MRFPCTFQCAQPDGALVLYLGAADDDESGATATRVVRVAPVGGRLVLFDARFMEYQGQLVQATPFRLPWFSFRAFVLEFERQGNRCITDAL